MTTHIRRNAIAYVALFVALGGTAFAAATVGSEDVIDNSMRSIDLRNGDVRSVDVRDDALPGGGLVGADVADRTITNADVGVGVLSSTEVQDESLTGRDVQPDSLDGSDVNERTLNVSDLEGEGSIASGSLDLSCNPNSSTFVRCGSPIDYSFIDETEVLVITTIQWHSNAGGASGQCRYVRNGSPQNSLTATMGEVENTTDFSHPNSATLLGVFVPSAGALEIALECRETESDIVLDDVVISTLALVA